MKKIYRIILFSLVTLIFNNTNAQTTGSFDTTITFQTSNRLLSLHVPTTYNSTNSYKLMICLHGLGDNSTNYRNALINSLAWNTNFPNTIFVCPESSTISADYYEPANSGNENIINECIALAKSKYNIDTNKIFLQGFSLGGRAALRFGLDNPTKFEGLLLNTPAIQGTKNAVNGAAYYLFNYSNANQIPIYITHGETDVTYTSSIDSSMEQLILNDGIVRLNRIANVGHTIPAYSLMNNVNNFFDTPTSPSTDIDLVKIYNKERTCASQANASCLIRNLGANTVNNVTVSYTLNGNTLNYTWNGTLTKFQHAIINLPQLNLQNGTQNINVNLINVNTSIIDTISNNNQTSNAIEYVNQPTNIPLFEGFEDTTTIKKWLFERIGDDYTNFSLDNTVAKTGVNSVFAFNTILYFDNAGRKAEFLSPVLNLSVTNTPNMTFDMAYNYQQYTPPYFTANVDFTDTLEILISTDCGNTFQSLYKKWGSQLATFSTPIINPLNINSCFINPADSNWRNETIDLSNFKTATDAVLKFSYISGLGGCIQIDNINFSTYPLSVTKQFDDLIKIYPNPANDYVKIKIEDNAINSVKIIDMSGRVLIETNLASIINNNYIINTEKLIDGNYILEIKSEKGTKTEKLQIMH